MKQCVEQFYSVRAFIGGKNLEGWQATRSGWQVAYACLPRTVGCIAN